LAFSILEAGTGTSRERAIIEARRLLTLATAKTVVPEEHP
jgi:hypothetical protein